MTRRRGSGGTAVMFSLAEFAFLLLFIAIAAAGYLYGQWQYEAVRAAAAERNVLAERLAKKENAAIPCWSCPGSTVPKISGTVTILGPETFSMSRNATGESVTLLADRRVIRLQAAFISVHFPRIFGITPASKELETLVRYGDADWLYRSLAAAAGIAVGSRSVLGTEGRYRARVVYPTFLRLLRLRLSRHRMEAERRGGGPAAVAGGRERFGLLYPHRITAARLEAARRKAGEQVRARRLSAAAGEELLLLRLHFAAHSLLTRAQLRSWFDLQEVFQKLETIHSYWRRTTV